MINLSFNPNIPTGQALFWEQLAGDDLQRLADYKRGWEYYYGNHDAQLRVKAGQPNDNVILNLAQYVVDLGVDFLFGQPVTFELVEGTTTPAEEALGKVWAANKQMTFLQKLALNGAVCGHVFAKILPNALPASAPGERPLPRLVVLDPAIVRPQWDHDDIEKVLWYKIEYASLDEKGREQFKRQMITRQPNDTWLIQDFVSYFRPRWQQVGGDQTWPYPWPPVIDCQNLPAPNEYFGLSDLENLPLQDNVNFLASNILRIVRYHAHPQTWGTGFKSDELKVGPSDMVTLPAGATLANLEMQSDLGSSLGYLESMVSWFLRICRIPDLDPAKVNVGALSGFALKILYHDLIDKTETKRRLYGDMLVELNRRILELLNFGSNNEVTIHWPQPLPESQKELAETGKIQLDMGVVSRETLATKMGFDWETEQERRAAEAVQERAANPPPEMPPGAQGAEGIQGGQAAQAGGAQAAEQIAPVSKEVADLAKAAVQHQAAALALAGEVKKQGGTIG
jgi:hypothetical protein